MTAIFYGAKFRVVCQSCGKRQPRATTDVTVFNWMTRHNRECPAIERPGGER